MQKAVARHDALMREALVAHGGYIVKATGDGFHAAFARAPDGLAAALAAQRAIQSEAWGEVVIRVRMGLHSGSAEERAGDYFGAAPNRGARLMSAGHGGQLLLSRAAYELVADQLPAQVELRDLGEHRLRDLSRPEHVFQAVTPALPAEFPPLRTMDHRPNNLPTQITSFVGREKDIADVSRLLTGRPEHEGPGEEPGPNPRLLTLVGPGGIGKTRLALEVAAAQLDHFTHGVFFVPLSSVASADRLVPMIADALGFNFDTYASDLDPTSQLLDYLRGRSMLLVMDNFEHLLEGANLLAHMLAQAPMVTLLVTSRERLNLRGEWSFEVHGMRYSGNGEEGDDAEAVQLFADRARQVSPNFSVTDDVRPHVNRICRLVEGMPLAVELASAWATVLTCQEIAEEIEKNVGFLATSMRDVPGKHRSMRAVFDQSYRRLTTARRNSFRRLSVFRGGFSRQAAMRVAQADLLALSEFVDRSLLRRTAPGRYEFHPLLRKYAEERLRAHPEEREQIQELHSRHYTGFLAERRLALTGTAMREARSEVRAEIDNIRDAADWAVTYWNHVDAIEVLAALQTFYLVHGWHGGKEAFEKIGRAAEARRKTDAQSRDPVLLAARAYQSMFAAQLGDAGTSVSLARESLPRLRELGLRREAGLCLWSLGASAALQGEYDLSKQHLAEAITLAREADELSTTAACFLWLGWVFEELGEWDQASETLQESYDLYHRHGNRWGMAFALSKLGLVADGQKKYDEGKRCHLQARDVFAKLGVQAGEAYTASRLSASAYGMGEYAEARRWGLLGYDSFKELGHRWGMAASLCRIGFAELGLGNIGEAKTCFYNGLGRATKMQYSPLALYALSGLASALAVEGRAERGVELFAFVRQHPQTHAFYIDLAERWFAGVEAKLPEDVLAAAKQKGSMSDLEAVVRAVTRLSTKA
jgi:predicted ATPase